MGDLRLSLLGDLDRDLDLLGDLDLLRGDLDRLDNRRLGEGDFLLDFDLLTDLLGVLDLEL